MISVLLHDFSNRLFKIQRNNSERQVIHFMERNFDGRKFLLNPKS